MNSLSLDPAGPGDDRPQLMRSAQPLPGGVGSDPRQTGPVEAGPGQAGVSRAGVSRAGVSRAGVSRAGASQPGSSRAGADLDLSTLGQPQAAGEPGGPSRVGGVAMGSRVPVPPGRLGEPLTVVQAGEYLRDLRRWVSSRQYDLAELDEVALAVSGPQTVELTSDLAVSLALWQAISDRCDLLELTFAGGRVGTNEQARLSTLVWGRLDAAEAGEPLGQSALAVNVPEACRLSDALTASLRARLGVDGSDQRARLKAARAGLERVREQLAGVPAPEAAAGERRRALLAERADGIAERLDRGADVEGVLVPLESEIALMERDLIVTAGQRLARRRDREAARARADELAARGAAIRVLEARCVESLRPAPKLAVPDVRALGDAPEGEALAGYLARLDQVARALDRVHLEYAVALEHLDALLAQVAALGVRADAARLDDERRADVEAIRRLLADSLEVTPVPLPRLGSLVAALAGYLDADRIGRPES